MRTRYVTSSERRVRVLADDNAGENDRDLSVLTSLLLSDIKSPSVINQPANGIRIILNTYQTLCVTVLTISQTRYNTRYVMRPVTVVFHLRRV